MQWVTAVVMAKHHAEFEQNVRCVGGIRWVLHHLRAARASSSRVLLYAILVRYVLAAVVEARNEEWMSGEEDGWGGSAGGEETGKGAEEREQMWEQACADVVGQLDDCAMPHALAQALWTR